MNTDTHTVKIGYDVAETRKDVYDRPEEKIRVSHGTHVRVTPSGNVMVGMTVHEIVSNGFRKVWGAGAVIEK